MTKSKFDAQKFRGLCTTLLMGLSLGTGLGASRASADYRVARGDVLEISIFGSPDLTRRTAVNIDGRI